MTRRRRTVIAAVAIGVVALVAGVMWRAVSDETGGSSARLDGTTLLALALPDTSGREQPLKQWKGKLLVVNFWATWCEPCREEMPRFVKLQDEYGDKGLQFVGIAIDQVGQGAAILLGDSPQLPDADRRLWGDRTLQVDGKPIRCAAVHRGHRPRRSHRSYSAGTYQRRPTSANNQSIAVKITLISRKSPNRSSLLRRGSVLPFTIGRRDRRACAWAPTKTRAQSCWTLIRDQGKLRLSASH